MIEKEPFQPTDVMCIVAMILVAGLYAITREGDLKTAFIGLILFVGGRQSKRLANGISGANGR